MQTVIISGSSEVDARTRDFFGANIIPGVNVLGHLDDPNAIDASSDLVASVDGILTEAAQAQILATGITHVRFPAGQEDAFFADGFLDASGNLKASLVAFLEQAKHLGLTVVLTIPEALVSTTSGKFVGRWISDGVTSDAAFYSDLQSFVQQLLASFPGVVTDIELGNEFWASRGNLPSDENLQQEQIYGAQAAQAAIAIKKAIDIVSATATIDGPDVYIQAAGFLGNPRQYGTIGDGAHRAANATIQAAFDSVVEQSDFVHVDLIDGVTANPYFTKLNELGEGGFDPSFDYSGWPLDEVFAASGAGGWEEWIGKDLVMQAGEYNISRRELRKGPELLPEWDTYLGEHGASVLLEHMSRLLEAGVNAANIWALAWFETGGALFSHGDTTIDKILIPKNISLLASVVDGNPFSELAIANATSRAAMFDLLRQTIHDHNLINLDWSLNGIDAASQTNALELTAFERSESLLGGFAEKVLFLSSRSNHAETFNLDLSGLFHDMTLVGIRAVSVDVEGGNNSSDALVTNRTDDVGTSDQVTISLKPYEVVQLTYVLADAQAISADDIIWERDPVAAEPLPSMQIGSEGDDSFIIADNTEGVYAHAGFDRVSLDADLTDIQVSEFLDDGSIVLAFQDKSFHLNDIEFLNLRGNSAYEVSLGTQADDILDGNALRHWDLMNGGAGNDTIDGAHGGDLIGGGSGNDVLRGHGGNDTLYGGGGDDEIHAHDGHDYVHAGIGRDLVFLGDGNDTVLLTNSDAFQSNMMAWNAAADQTSATGSIVSVAGKTRFETVIDGGLGHDVLRLGDGSDALFLHDNYSAFHHDTDLRDDLLHGPGTARLTSIEEIRAGDGDDVIDLSSDIFGPSVDQLFVHGEDGNDVLWGNQSDDFLYGGNGDDTLFGGSGSDFLEGGNGADVFEFAIGSDSVTIADFDYNEGDRLRFYNSPDFYFDEMSLNVLQTAVSVAFKNLDGEVAGQLSIEFQAQPDLLGLENVASGAIAEFF